MGSSARLTLVLLLIFVLGTALLLDGKDKKKNPEQDQAKAPLSVGGDVGPGPFFHGGPVISETGTPARPAPVAPDPPGRPVRQPDPPRVERPAAPQPRPQVGGWSGRVATVQAGDSWWRIAKREMGDGNQWQALQRANAGVERLHPGVELRVPEVDRSGSAAAPVAAPVAQHPAPARPREPSRPSGGPQVHVVAEGERLWDIARRYYGRGSLHYVIANHNGLSDDARLRVGTKLEIPAHPNE